MSQHRLDDLVSIQNTVEGLEKMQEYLKDRLTIAIQNEKELRDALQQETDRSKQLEVQLCQEREDNASFKELLQMPDTEIDQTESRDGVSDPQHSFGTVSTVLMQYKYDEISLQNKRLLRAYVNKSREVKEANNTITKLQEQHFKLHERIEDLCCRYLNYKMKKHDEIFELKACIERQRLLIAELVDGEGNGKDMDFLRNVQKMRDEMGDHLR